MSSRRFCIVVNTRCGPQLSNCSVETRDKTPNAPIPVQSKKSMIIRHNKPARETRRDGDKWR